MPASRPVHPLGLMILLTLGGSWVLAATPSECKIAIDRISVKAGKDFDTVAKERLDEDLEEASHALVQGRPADALRHLGDFRSRVMGMRDAKEPRLPKANADKLLEGAQRAIECVETLRAPSEGQR